jgi:hypothetical protein
VHFFTPSCPSSPSRLWWRKPARSNRSVISYFNL